MNFYQQYADELHKELSAIEPDLIDEVVELLFLNWKQGKKVFICGNGGSSANAMHIANDFTYGVNPGGRAINIEAMTANSAVLTCLANDTGYDSIFSAQLITKAQAGDVLIVLSGSGQSPNVIEAILAAKSLNMTSVAILGYDGGKAKAISDIAIHSDIDDMQIAEDIQVIIGHWMMRVIKNKIDTYEK